MDEREINVIKTITSILETVLNISGAKNTGISVSVSNTLGIKSRDIVIHTADEPENIQVIYQASAMPDLYDGWKESVNETPVE